MLLYHIPSSETRTAAGMEEQIFLNTISSQCGHPRRHGIRATGGSEQGETTWRRVSEEVRGCHSKHAQPEVLIWLAWMKLPQGPCWNLELLILLPLWSDKTLQATGLLWVWASPCTHGAGGPSALLFSTSAKMHPLCKLLFFTFFLGSDLCQERCSPAANPLLPWILLWFALTLSHPPKPSKSRNRGMGSCRLYLPSQLLPICLISGVVGF